jgi:uncharacterized protein YcbK (DUF882 family)
MIVEDWSVYKHFSRSEFACKCGCSKTLMQTEFMGRLQSLRMIWGKPMVITSGYRCPNHPSERGKQFPGTGTHSQGIAADIGISGAEAISLLRLALDNNFTGIGVQQKGNGRFLHLDIRESPAIWSY